MLIKRNSFTRILRVIMCCITIGILMPSCDDKYDFENINGDIHIFEGGISAPIGNSEKFYLSDFIEANEMLVIEDGRYVLQYSGHIDSSPIEVPVINIDAIDPDISVTHLDFVESLREVPEIAAALDAMGYTGGPLPSISGLIVPDAHTVIEPKTEYFDFTINDIPSEVVNIQSVKPGEDALVTLSLHAEGFPTTINNLTFELVVRPPVQMQIESVDGSIWRDEDGLYHIEHDIPCKDGVLDDDASFYLRSIEFNPPLERTADNTIRINSELYYAGEIHINEPFDMAGWVPVVDMQVGFVSAPTIIKSVKACVQTDIEPINNNIEFTSIPEILQNPNICLDLQSVNLHFDIDNHSPLSIESDVNLQTTFIDNTTSPVVYIEDWLKIDANTRQSLFLTSDAKYAADKGYMPELNQLVERVPKSFALNAHPSVPATDVELNAGEAYSASVDYRMNLPIVFGDKVNLELETSVTGLGGNSETLATLPNIVLSGLVESTLPLDLAMEAVACQADGTVMHNVSIEGLPIIRAESVTEMRLSISVEGDKETLDKFDTIVFKIKGTSENGGELAPTQYLQLKNIGIELPEGIFIEESAI